MLCYLFSLPNTSIAPVSDWGLLFDENRRSALDRSTKVVRVPTRKRVGENLGQRRTHAGSRMHTYISLYPRLEPLRRRSVGEFGDVLSRCDDLERSPAPVVGCAWISIASPANHNSPRPHAFCSCSMRRNRVSE